jgi:hypothetical protein
MHRSLVNVAGALLFGVLLGCSSSPVAPSPPPAGSPFAKTFAPLVGYHGLTIEIDERCAAFPPSLRVRHYDTVVENPGYHYLHVRVVGGGFSEPVIIAELWVGTEQIRWPSHLKWNQFEDATYPERLTGSTQLYLSGSGEATVAESTISGLIHGTASIKGSVPEVSCTGSHRFTFVRPAQ